MNLTKLEKLEKLEEIVCLKIDPLLAVIQFSNDKKLSEMITQIRNDYAELIDWDKKYD